MISLIICSKNSEVLPQLQANIAATIGGVYETIIIDNRDGKYGICEAYNIGASQAKYKLLCFMHEDLRFHTDGWGQVVADILGKPDAGVVGVAGGTYQLKAPTSWISNTDMCLRTNVLHAVGKPFLRIDYANPMQQTLAEVATVDGLWMCCRKDVWQEFPFDENAFPHFHFYDIDFCTHVQTKYKNYVTFDVLIEHFSEGTFKLDWTINALRYYRIRNKMLPFGTTDLSPKAVKELEFKIFQQTLKSLINYKAKAKYIAYCVYCCMQRSLLNRDTLWIARQYLKSKVTNKSVFLG